MSSGAWFFIAGFYLCLTGLAASRGNWGWVVFDALFVAFFLYRASNAA